MCSKCHYDFNYSLKHSRSLASAQSNWHKIRGERMILLALSTSHTCWYYYQRYSWTQDISGLDRLQYSCWGSHKDSRFLQHYSVWSAMYCCLVLRTTASTTAGLVSDTSSTTRRVRTIPTYYSWSCGYGRPTGCCFHWQLDNSYYYFKSTGSENARLKSDCLIDYGSSLWAASETYYCKINRTAIGNLCEYWFGSKTKAGAGMDGKLSYLAKKTLFNPICAPFSYLLF